MTCNTTVFDAAILALEEEYRLLDNPNVATLANFIEKKQAIGAMLSEADLTLEQATSIRSIAERNQRRLSAVSRGTADALQSLRAFKSGRVSALHYASDGSRSALKEENANIIKRA